MTEYEVGPDDNLFEALGVEKAEAANLLFRADLMIEISRFIKDKGMTLRNAGAFFGISHSRVNDILHGNIEKFTIDYLVNLLSKTDRKVMIHVETISPE